jgi:hypothetical protein
LARSGGSDGHDLGGARVAAGDTQEDTGHHSGHGGQIYFFCSFDPFGNMPMDHVCNFVPYNAG